MKKKSFGSAIRFSLGSCKYVNFVIFSHFHTFSPFLNILLKFRVSQLNFYILFLEIDLMSLNKKGQISYVLVLIFFYQINYEDFLLKFVFFYHVLKHSISFIEIIESNIYIY